jgi:serine/threonine-protein kinase
VPGEFQPARHGRRLGGLEPGTLVGGYRVEDRIGSGGMATVYRAWDESLGRAVALKVLKTAVTDDDDFRERFIRESRAASAVDHPNIIPVHAAGEDNGALYLAMRYVAGGDLHSLVEKEGTLPVERALALLAPVASALDAAHDAGVVHRDVKPANILIDHSRGRQDHPYLSDFGLAKRSVTHTLTNTGEFVGTAGFASPEQLSGKPVTPQTDQYALACVAYTVLTASLPFQHGDPEAALWAQMSQPPPRVTEKRPELFPAVDDAIARAMSKDPAQRYASCGDFVAELRQALVTPTDGGRLPTRLPGRQPEQAVPGRLPDHAPTQAAEPEPPRHGAPLPGGAFAHPGSTLGAPAPSTVSARPGAPARPAAPARSTSGPAAAGPSAFVPLHGPQAPSHHRLASRESRRRSRRRTIAIRAGAAILVAAAVAGGAALLSGGKSNQGGLAPSSVGPVTLAATLSTGTGQGPVSLAFGPGSTLSSAGQSGAISTFSIASQRATGTPSPPAAGADPAAARFSLDGTMLVSPAGTCAASCTYTVSGVGGTVGGQTISGGPGPVFSTGSATMAAADVKGDGVDVWNLQSGAVTGKGLADPDHGAVKATAIDPTGQAVAVSSGAAGPSHHVYWWALQGPSLGAAETVPAAMGVPWAPAGVSGLPLGLTGQTLALSDGQTTDVYRALPDQPAQAQTHSVPGGLMAVSPDNGNLVATTDPASPDRIDLWNADSGLRTAALTFPSAPSSVQFSSDGKSVAVGCANGDVYVWTITGP